MKFSYVLASTLFLNFFSVIGAANDLVALRNCVNEGYQSLRNRNSIVAAVLDAQDSKVMIFGKATENQIFEIGSITKTFTANLLAQSIVTGELKLSDAIPEPYQKPGSTITYQNLTTHTSGIIPGIFPKFQVTNPLAPFDGLTIPIFKVLFAETELAFQPGTDWSYSNIGVSLLGLILAERSNVSYEDLINRQIFKVLGMNDSYFQVPTSALSRFPEGSMVDAQSGKAQAVPHWDLFSTAIDPAGGIRSTIGDMVKYARANLAPQNSPLASFIQASQQQLYYIQKAGMWIGMNWLIEPDLGLIWHNGATYGFNSILAISKKRGQAIVAMADTTVWVDDANGNPSLDESFQKVAFDCLK